MNHERIRTNKFNLRNYLYFLSAITFFSILLSFFLINADVFSAQNYSETSHESLNLVNRKRVEYDVPQLGWSEELANAAKEKAEDMIRDKYFEHFSSDGKSPWSFIEENNYNYISAGENLAIDFTDLNDAEVALENSQTHLLNIVNPKYREFGSYLTQGNIFGYESNIYVQMFGSRNKVIDRIFYNLDL